MGAEQGAEESTGVFGRDRQLSTPRRMEAKTFVRQIRLVLRIVAVGIWINTVFNYSMRCVRETKKPPTKEVVGVFNELTYPTILVCNTMQGAPLENRQVCDVGPKPSTLVGDRRRCVPVESI